MKRNKIYARCILLILMMLFLVIIVGQTIIEAKIIVKVAQTNAADHPVGIGLTYFEKRVEELTGGELDVRVYHAGALGGARESIEAVQLGQIEIASVTGSNLETFAKEFDIFGLPFLFSSYDHIKKALAEGTHLSTELEKALERIGLVSLGLTTGGTRQVYSKTPIEGIEDVKDKRIRTMEVPTIIATWKALGAIPVPIATPEIYSALQTGIVDMAESSFLTWVGSKHIEVAKYGARLNYMDSGRVFFTNKKFWEELSVEQRKAIKLAMKESIDIMFEEYVKQDEEVEKTALSVNAVITHPDLEPFIQALQPIYEEFKPTLGFEMLKEIQNMK